MQRSTVFLPFLLVLCLLVLPQTAISETIFTDAPLKQNWIKRGIILAPGFAGPRSSEFVSSPSVVRLKDGRLRMYVWVADGSPPWLRGRHIIIAAEADPSNPFHWEVVPGGAMVGPDPDSPVRARGVGFPFVLPRSDGPWFMYYGTWSGKWAVKEELTNRIGLALSHDEGLTWEVVEEDLLPSGPPGSFDQGAIPSVDVLHLGRDDYRMWYTAAGEYLRFGKINQGTLHIGAARSDDGIHWNKLEQPAMRARQNGAEPYEACLARPAVLKLDGVYHMWFGVYDMAPESRPNNIATGENQGERKAAAGGSYRLEYARSSDGINWTRYADQPIMPLTQGGFDSRSQTYASVVDMGEQIWLFYTGDGLGATGIGLATLDKDELRSD